MINELHYTQLQPSFGVPVFDTTRDLSPREDLIGQERAERALTLGLSVKSKGYNIYAAGEAGVGKTTFSKKFAHRQAAAEPLPPDAAYIHNFDSPRSPKILTLPPGTGKLLAREIEELVDEACEELSKTFSGKDFEACKLGLVKGYQARHDELLREVSEEAKKSNFGVKTTTSGMYFMPIIDGELISEEAFEELDEDVKAEIIKNSEAISVTASATIRNIKDFEQAVRKDIDDLEFSVGLFTLGRLFTPIMNKYAELESIVRHLSDIKEDMLDNLSSFINTESEEEESIAAMLPWYQRKNTAETLSKYKLNLICDNSSLSGAPVIVDYNPTYANLFGEIEYDNEYGNLTTDFLKIRPGLVHRANGGYLILQASDVFSSPYAWETLRRVLITGEIAPEPRPESATSYTLSGLRPEALGLNLKVILVGSHYLYELINDYDDDFGKLFKICADFDYEIDMNDQSVMNTICFIKSYVERENLKHLDYGAVSLVCKYSSRIAESSIKLTSGFNKLSEILIESNAHAAASENETVTAEHVRLAIEEREFRHDLYESKLVEMLENRTIMIDTDGTKVGQLNALAVYETGGHIFGKPSRITATTYVGKSGIVNIEKEAELSGPIHNKGVLVLAGYLGQTYAQDFPLALSCRVAFEQTYSGVEGDSASAAEALAILSSLSGVSIRQGIAVTGSLNQMGEVQAVGGVTHKIEGFFDLCKKRGLTGSQGVIIPTANICDLVLKDSVVEAVKAGSFHIYPISTLDEGIEILTGTEAGTRDRPGRFPPASVHGKAHKKLREFHKKSMA
ncbi:MAG: AAA family ATPase [Defluviitaleaceae bacterium]|nr:AAA family ATPase [Defluviitaleaceae bacterium]